jgi:hypothetical protein
MEHFPSKPNFSHWSGKGKRVRSPLLNVPSSSVRATTKVCDVSDSLVMTKLADGLSGLNINVVSETAKLPLIAGFLSSSRGKNSAQKPFVPSNVEQIC